MPLPSYPELLELFTTAESVEQIHGACSRLCETFEYDFFLYGEQVPTSFVDPQIFIISGFPEKWWHRYKEANYFRIDPTIAHCQKSVLPICWGSYLQDDTSDPEVTRFLNEAREYGLVTGISFPVHGAHGEKALLSLGCHNHKGAEAPHRTEQIPYLQMLANCAHESVKRIVTIEEINVHAPQLSRREQECLLWAAEGKTAWETGQILAISERTVVFHLNNAAAKLRVSNRQHAVARAVSLGLILPQFN